MADNSYLRSKTLYPQGRWIPVAEKSSGTENLIAFSLCVLFTNADFTDDAEDRDWKYRGRMAGEPQLGLSIKT